MYQCACIIDVPLMKLEIIAPRPCLVFAALCSTWCLSSTSFFSCCCVDSSSLLSPVDSLSDEPCSRSSSALSRSNSSLIWASAISSSWMWPVASFSCDLSEVVSPWSLAACSWRWWHLRSEDFFKSSAFRVLRFSCEGVEVRSNGSAAVFSPGFCNGGGVHFCFVFYDVVFLCNM